MKFRNYCIVVMGFTEGISLEISKISDINPNILDAKGIVIATFTATAEPSELTEYFKLNGRNFLLFDLDEKHSGYNIIKKNIHEGLFGFLSSVDELKKRTEEMIDEIIYTSDTKDGPKFDKGIVVKTKIRQPREVEITDEEIAKMSNKEKMELLDSIIDKGADKLTKKDKELAKKLAK